MGGCGNNNLFRSNRTILKEAAVCDLIICLWVIRFVFVLRFSLDNINSFSLIIFYFLSNFMFCFVYRQDLTKKITRLTNYDENKSKKFDGSIEMFLVFITSFRIHNLPHPKAYHASSRIAQNWSENYFQNRILIFQEGLINNQIT
jgi:hypothetical protein